MLRYFGLQAPCLFWRLQPPWSPRRRRSRACEQTLSALVLRAANLPGRQVRQPPSTSRLPRLVSCRRFRWPMPWQVFAGIRSAPLFALMPQTVALAVHRGKPLLDLHERTPAVRLTDLGFQRAVLRVPNRWHTFYDERGAEAPGQRSAPPRPLTRVRPSADEEQHVRVDHLTTGLRRGFEQQP